MKKALLEKFRQNPALLALLLGTQERRLMEASTADSYWGIGPKNKGLNRLGMLLTEVRTELKDVRPDQSLLAEASESSESSSSSASSSEASPEALADEAADGAEAAVASAMEVVPKQSGGGGVYLFINSAATEGVEQKARRARQRGGNQRISWAGSDSVSDRGGDGGGGDNDKMEMGGGAATEVMVEKLGS